MIDAALPGMIDEVLISAGKFDALAVAPGRHPRHLRVISERRILAPVDAESGKKVTIMLAPAASLFDQTALTDRAERLVKAALAAGADTADAVAVRGMSQSIEVRDGQVEESESSEGDDLGLRVLVGRRQAVVSTNDVSGDGSKALAERAVAMARAAPEDKYAGLADEALLAHTFPDLDLIDRNLPSVPATRSHGAGGRSKPASRSRASPSRAARRPRPASAAWCW